MEAEVDIFLRQYRRKRQRGREPNDRHYDRQIEERVKHMDPLELDALLRGDMDDLRAAEDEDARVGE